MSVAAASRRALLKFAMFLAGAAIILAPAGARAQVLGTWSTAVPAAPDEFRAGGFLLLGEPIGVVGNVRTGIGDNWDIGIQLGFPDFDFGGNTLFGIAGDVKYLLVPESVDFPVDFAGDVAFGYQHAGDLDIVDFDFGAVMSKELVTTGGTTLIPYGSVMFAIGRFSFDSDVLGSVSDTEFDIHVRGGLAWPFREDVDFHGELNLSSRDETLAIHLGLMVEL
jgi:hypothetical protein